MSMAWGASHTYFLRYQPALLGVRLSGWVGVLSISYLFQSIAHTGTAMAIGAAVAGCALFGATVSSCVAVAVPARYRWWPWPKGWVTTDESQQDASIRQIVDEAARRGCAVRVGGGSRRVRRRLERAVTARGVAVECIEISEQTLWSIVALADGSEVATVSAESPEALMREIVVVQAPQGWRPIGQMWLDNQGGQPVYRHALERMVVVEQE